MAPFQLENRFSVWRVATARTYRMYQICCGGSSGLGCVD